MNDGAPIKATGALIRAVPTPEIVSQVFIEQNLGAQQLAFAHSFCLEAEMALTELHDFALKNILDPAGRESTLRLRQSSEFNAGASTLFGVERSYMIEVSLAAPVVLLSVAHELTMLEHDPAYKNTALKGNSVESFFVGTDCGTSLPDAVTEVALDALRLLFLHEMAHIVFGHCNVSLSAAKEVRAIESHADVNAGSMFVLWLPRVQGRIEIEKLIARFVRATLLLATVLKACSAKTEDYHYPTTRLQYFLAGGVFALTKQGVVPDFVDINKGNEYWADRVKPYQEKFMRALRGSSLRYYAGTEKDLEDDARAVEDTIVVRDRLIDTVLAPHIVRRSSK